MRVQPATYPGQILHLSFHDIILIIEWVVPLGIPPLAHGFIVLFIPKVAAQWLSL